MKYGQGKPAQSPAILSIRPLTKEDLASFKPGWDSKIDEYRDSHHRLARLIAAGLRPAEVALACGYAKSYMHQLMIDPTFMELVAHYREVVNDEFKEATAAYYETQISTRNATARLLNDVVLKAQPEDIPLRTLLAIHDSTADRTGFGKRSTVDINVDWASRLDKAIERSDKAKLIEGTVNNQEAAE